MSRSGLAAADPSLQRVIGGSSVPVPHVVALLHLLALLCVVAPLLMVDVPPLVDYPNHLARMQVLSELENSPDLQAIYRVEWAAIPNLAMDVLVPQMARLVGVLAAGKIFIGTTFVLIAAGVVAIRRALYGRVGFWPLITYVFLYNYVLAYGFLNFLFGIGLFLLFFAFWIASCGWPWPRRVAVATLGSSLIFFSHVGAFATYGLCIAAYELDRWLRSEARWPKALLWAASMVVVQCSPALVLMLTLTPSMPGPLDLHYDFVKKMTAVVVPTLFYEQTFDLLILAALVTAFVIATHGRRIELAAALRFPVAGLGLAVIAVPTWALDNFGNDFRLAVPLIFLLIAGSRVRLERSRKLVVAASALLLFSVRTLVIGQQWMEYDRLYSELRTAAQTVEPGARILPAVDDWSDVHRVAPTPYRRVFYHAPALILLERPVFLPSLFTAQGRQPLSVQPAYAPRDVPHMQPVPANVLVQAADPDSRRELLQTQPHATFYDRLAGWPADFDYVLMLQFGGSDNPLPKLLMSLHRGSFFTLYKVLRED